MAKSKRQSIGNSLRFKVLSRYQFTCIYCGGTPPSVLLEIDHIIPVSKGGTNDIENLTCSCFECNRGKRDKLIDKSQIQILDDLQQKKLNQFKEYLKYVKSKEKLTQESVEMVCEVYTSFNPGYQPALKYRQNIKSFIDKIGLEKTLYAMSEACLRAGGNMKYFCGICWNIFNGKTKEY